MTDIKVEVTTITPEVAEQWLSHNTHNRNIRYSFVEQLASAIKRGEWELNGDAIRFAEDGTLLDGQHRLLAVLEAELPIQSVVITGLPAEAQATMDTGKKRTLADVLRLRGEKSCVTLAAAINWSYRYEVHRLSSRTSKQYPSYREALNWLDKNPGIFHSIAVAEVLRSNLRVAAGVYSALHYQLSKIDSDDADAFFSRLAVGANLDEHNPIFVLRKVLLKKMDKTGKQGDSSDYIWQFAIVIKAWNAWRKGKQISVLSWKQGGASPEPMPVPE